MTTVLPTAGIMLLTGLVFGSTVCNLTCGPLILVRMGGRGKGWRDGAALALLYSIPRVLVLTFFGAMVAGAGHLLSEPLGTSAMIYVQAIVYLLIGLLMVANGLSFSRSDEGCSRSRFGDRILSGIVPRLPGSERFYMFILGVVFSLVCTGEAWGILGLASVQAALGEGSVLSAAGTGALYMFSFSLGLSMPPIGLAALASEAGRRFELAQYLKVGGYILMLIGGAIVLYEIFVLARLSGLT